MKIALYYPWIYLKSGAERTILETVKRSKHVYTIFTNHFDPEGTYPEFKNLNVIELERVPVARNIRPVLKAAFKIARQKIDLKGFDLLMVHSDGLADLILMRNNNLPVIGFCHTPLRPVYDEYYRERALNERSFGSRTYFKLFSLVFKTVDRILWKRYSFIFFNSHETRNRAEKGGLLKGIHGKNEVIYPGIDTANTKPSGTYGNYFYLPGRIMWTKNIELVIEAFKSLKHQNKNNVRYSNLKLIIAGQVDHKSRKYFEYLKKLADNRNDIDFVINPADSVMLKLYSGCLAVLSSSFNEDWGMTIIEGYAFGKPAIAIKRGGALESVRNGQTGYLVEEKVKDYAGAMSRIAGDIGKLKSMGKYARKISLNYDWEIFIRRLDLRIKETKGPGI